MKKTIYLVAAAAALSLSLPACESFLDEVPESTRTSENFFQSRSDFLNAVHGAYNGLKLRGLYANGSGALMVLQETVSDNTLFGATRQPINNSTFEIDELLFTKSNTILQDAWLDHYATIARCNLIITKLPEAPASSTFTTADRTRYDAEARFLRALCYFNLVRLFGDVPLVTAPIEGPYGAAGITRTPAAEVYQLIIDDLTVAGAQLPLPAAIPANESGRATRWAARTLLGKVYLTQGNFALALPVLRDVNDNSGRSLMTSFPAIFSAATSFAANTEVIFAVQYRSGLLTQGSQAAGATGSVGVTQGSDLWTNWAPPGSGFMLLPNGGGGGGFNTPTEDMAAAFETGDQRKAATLLESYPTSTTATAQGRYSVKFRQNGAVGGDSDVDFPVMRLADVVLMLSEALNETGNTSGAITQLNRIRTRAGLPARPLTLTQAALRLAIEQERRVELAFENHRWPDLVRTNRFVPVMSSKGFTVQPYQALYPVPQRETDLNPSLTQNPGY